MNILEQNKEKINGVFSTFDRMIINGYILPLQNPRLFQFYLIQNNVKFVNFKAFAEKQTSSLCNHIDNFINENGISLQYLKSGKDDKQELAKKALEESNNKTGLIAAFSAVELCRTSTIQANHEAKKLEPTIKNTKCKHYYLYFNDEEFGLMFFRIQTWFPYNIQIYINGREYCSKLFDKNNIKYEMYNNSFSYIDDFDKAQKLADNILNQKLSDSFDGLANKINNILPNIKETLNHSYYWCIDQCEFATDINFKCREDLSIFYKKLVETSYFTFSCSDIYAFFGRKIEYLNRFDGEITSDLRNRYQGYRIKFKINNNQIKMYDKGNNLRIEVTINNPKDFKVMKEKEVIVEHKKIETEKVWLPMGKSVSNIYRYVEISKNIINRYIEALPTIDIEQVSLKELENISTKIEVSNRNYSGFNLLQKDTLIVFQEIANGKYLNNGFTNKQIRKNLYENYDSKKNINKTTRLLVKLKVHGIIKKVNRKNKYYLTSNGRKLINNLLLYTGKIILS